MRRPSISAIATVRASCASSACCSKAALSSIRCESGRTLPSAQSRVTAWPGAGTRGCNRQVGRRRPRPGDRANCFLELSGGMQKRVALARAIAREPEIIFFDEPTTGLDPIMADVINDLIVKCVSDLAPRPSRSHHDMASARRSATGSRCCIKPTDLAGTRRRDRPVRQCLRRTSSSMAAPKARSACRSGGADMARAPQALRLPVVRRRHEQVERPLRILRRMGTPLPRKPPRRRVLQAVDWPAGGKAACSSSQASPDRRRNRLATRAHRRIRPRLRRRPRGRLSLTDRRRSRHRQIHTPAPGGRRAGPPEHGLRLHLRRGGARPGAPARRAPGPRDAPVQLTAATSSATSSPRWSAPMRPRWR